MLGFWCWLSLLIAVCCLLFGVWSVFSFCDWRVGVSWCCALLFWCSLFVVCCLMVAVPCSLSVVCCVLMLCGLRCVFLLLVVGCQVLFVVCWL